MGHDFRAAAHAVEAVVVSRGACLLLRRAQRGACVYSTRHENRGWWQEQIPACTSATCAGFNGMEPTVLETFIGPPTGVPRGAGAGILFDAFVLFIKKRNVGSGV